MSKILVIEDNEPLRNDVIEMLRFEGFDVRGAENGVVGVNVAREYKPDLILCDVMMPELDGYGVLEKVRMEQQAFMTPFIFLTAKTDSSDIRFGMGLGADDYLTKPFQTPELLTAIRARLNHGERIKTMLDLRLKELSDSIITALPHELRTPLNTIIGFSDMLMSEAEHIKPEQTIEWAEYINLAAQRLYRLVENYLIYVRAEIMSQNEVELAAQNKKFVDHPNIVVQFHAMHKAQQVGRSKDVVIQMGEDTRVRISDHDLGKIVEEVIDNALKFSELGTPILLGTQLRDDKYILTVEDKGRGMTQEQINSIGAYMQFERWFYEQQGSGLGLSIVKRLSELYGGTLTLESEVDKGTTATIEFAVSTE